MRISLGVLLSLLMVRAEPHGTKRRSVRMVPVDKNATADEENEIRQLLLATSKVGLGSQANGWKNPGVRGRFGYHSIQIGSLNFIGQRNPNERLEILRRHVDFRDKVVVDLGCNVGGMLHHLVEAKYKYGFDYDATCVKAATRIAEIFRLPETFQQADLNIFEPSATFSTFKYTPDIVFMFSIGSWVRQWKKLYTAVANTGVKLIVLETNNDREGAPQLELFRRLGRSVQLISRAQDDITGNLKRKTYLVSR
jgi:SAM-dependent methyltransferase